jgi:Cu(I)/Ag(I) efflux system membrane fusion protein/cobalt-zinc-cadmium efflux system membrane fusion protein
MNADWNDKNPVTRRVDRRRRILANFGWLVGGAVLAILLVVDPLDLHPADLWIHELLHGHGEAAAGGATAVAEARQFWTCGMHPEVLQDEPGSCPICHMDLTPIALEPGATVSASGGERSILFYRNPMDPTVTSPMPMKDSMGMDYVPVYEDEVEGAATSGPLVTIDPGIVQNMNVVTATVQRRDLSREIRTVGYLDYDQEKMVSVTTKFPGFVERVFVNYVGEPVRRGQPLFEIFSSELVQTQNELLSALAYSRRLEDAPEAARRRAESLADAARQRLAYWDIGADQIRRLESGGEVQRALTVTAPSSGLVMMRMAGLEGMAVRPGMELFHIADLSTLWLSVEVFEDQLSWLREGSEAEIRLSYFPGEVFRGRVRFVEPQVSEKTRTVGLRVEVSNRDGRLRAGMYATVRFEPVVAHDAVTVPALAVLRTGDRDLVVVALGDGRFAPREVELGAEGERAIQVLSGLEAGERIVTSAQFLIDSESNLREAVQKLLAARRSGAAPPGTGAPSGHAGH